MTEDYEDYPKTRRTGTGLLSLALIVGLIGGMLGSYSYIQYFAKSIPVSKQQLTIDENSAVIDVAKKVSPSVVSIVSSTDRRGAFGGTFTQEGAGTGIVLSSDGLILTNKHVVPSDASEFSVFTSDGKEYKDAKVIARDPLNDIAFVKIKASGLTAANLADSSDVVVGQRVVAIGNALGQFQNSVTEGVISGLGRPVTAGDGNDLTPPEQLQNLLQTDAAINPGNSGGPLVNLAGQVVGINTAVAGNAQNIGFAIPINEAKAAIASVKKDGRIVRPYLGVRYVPISEEFAAANDLKVNRGAYLEGNEGGGAVVSGSPADKAGLTEGDIITRVGGKRISESRSLQSLIGANKVGDKIELTILRDNKTMTVDVTLEEAPSNL